MMTTDGSLFGTVDMIHRIDLAHPKFNSLKDFIPLVVDNDFFFFSSSPPHVGEASLKSRNIRERQLAAGNVHAQSNQRSGSACAEPTHGRAARNPAQLTCRV
jgi:hypothetical protein